MDYHQVKEADTPISIVPTDTDVLLGKGTPINRHAGNVAFRELIRQHHERYDTTPEGSKHLVAKEIVDNLLNQGWRFLLWQLSSKVWEEVPIRRAYLKAQQTLRDGAPERRQRRQEQEREKFDEEIAWLDQALGREEDHDSNDDDEVRLQDDCSFHSVPRDEE